MTALSRGLAVLGALTVLLACGGCRNSPYHYPTSRAHAFPSPLAGACWPLPGTGRFDFGHQVVGQYRSADRTRWVLTLQWDELGRSEVAARVTRTLTAAGFVPAGTRQGWTVMSRAAYGEVAFRLDPLPGVAPDAVVRGTVLLDLPARAARGRRAHGCTPIPRLPPGSPDTVLGRTGP